MSRLIPLVLISSLCVPAHFQCSWDKIRDQSGQVGGDIMIRTLVSLHSRRTWHRAGAKGIDREDVFEESLSISCWGFLSRFFSLVIHHRWGSHSKLRSFFFFFNHEVNLKERGEHLTRLSRQVLSTCGCHWQTYGERLHGVTPSGLL